MLRHRFRLLALAGVGILGSGVEEARASSVLLTETFKGTSAPGWTMTGMAQLTAGTVDTPGTGWLRLTPNTKDQTGFAYLDDALPFNYGLDIDFRYSVWGGTGADGFALVMFDGSATPTSAGAYGGSLGYAQHGSVAGLQGAILGIGFDEFGNFANPTEGRQGGTGFTPDAISVRGPGDGTANALTSWGVENYGFIASTGNLAGQGVAVGNLFNLVRPVSNSSYREAEVIVDTTRLAEGKLPIKVLLQYGTTGQKTVVADYDAYDEVVAYYGSVSNIPQTMKFGFTSSTGSSTDYHEIQGLSVTSVASAPGYAEVVTATPEGSSLSLAVAGMLMVGLSKVIRRRRIA